MNKENQCPEWRHAGARKKSIDTVTIVECYVCKEVFLPVEKEISNKTYQITKT